MQVSSEPFLIIAWIGFLAFLAIARRSTAEAFLLVAWLFLLGSCLWAFGRLIVHYLQ